MDSYNRYMSQATGGKPESQAEALAFGVIEFLTITRCLPVEWKDMSGKDKSEFIDELASQLTFKVVDYLIPPLTDNASKRITRH